MTQLKLEWGGQPPEDTKIAWGARAIYKLVSHDTIRSHAGRGMRGRVVARASTEAQIDLLWDRQSSASAPSVTDKERAAFDRWLNKKALPALRRACVKAYLTGDSDDSVTVESGGYKLTASPRASYGYLYIVAWRVEPIELASDVNTPAVARRTERSSVADEYDAQTTASLEGACMAGDS